MSANPKTPAFFKVVFILTIGNVLIGILAALVHARGIDDPGYTSSMLIIVEFAALVLGLLLGLIMFVSIIILFATGRWKVALGGIALGILSAVGWYGTIVLDAPTLLYMT